MKRPELALRQRALLSAQRALWDMVTPDLRGVALRIEQSAIAGRFIYDRPPDGELEEIVSECETEVIADFPSNITIVFRAEYLSEEKPRSLLEHEHWVYLRRETR